MNKSKEFCDISYEKEWVDTSRLFLVQSLVFDIVFNLCDFVFRMRVEKGYSNYELRRIADKNILVSDESLRKKQRKEISITTAKLIIADVIGLFSVHFWPVISMVIYWIGLTRLYKECYRDIKLPTPYHLPLFIKQEPVVTRVKYLLALLFVIMMAIIYSAVIVHWFMILSQCLTYYRNMKIIGTLIVSIPLAIYCGYIQYGIQSEIRERAKPVVEDEDLQRLDRLHD